MKELVIISGKGGTGKTSLSAAFASLAANHIICDADVDAADMHLLLSPEIKKRTAFHGGHKAHIRQQDCSGCGICRQMCRFDAIDSNYAVSQTDCEGCKVCVSFCPEAAIDFPLRRCGEWYISETRFAPLVHARLGIAEENSGKLVSLIRREARELAAERNCGLLITDGPPGIGCPVIASISGATAVLIVVEPTLSSIHDMKRVTDLANHFSLPALICINKYDLNNRLTRDIYHQAERTGLEVVGAIPFDPVFTKAMLKAKTVTEFNRSSVRARNITKIWNRIAASEALSQEQAPTFIQSIKQTGENR